MTTTRDCARRAAAGLRAFAGRREAMPVMVGFDGFVDSIVHVVDSRKDAATYTTVPTIARFGEKVSAAAGRSANFELVVARTKLGGNGPIMASALVALGLPVTYLGALGYPVLHPVFAELGRKSTTLSFAEPGVTDALEFADGKLMLGKHASLGDVNLTRLLEVVGAARLRAVVEESRLLAMVNWTMLTSLTGIWRYLIDDVLPGLDRRQPRRLVFVDLADPEKRPRQDLLAAVRLCAEFTPFADVTLGLNLKEAAQVAQALGVSSPECASASLVATAREIRAELGVATVVIHPRERAAAATRVATDTESAELPGPFVREPVLSTGAGDNFNAGFVLAQLSGMSLAECLSCGMAASGYYVRRGSSASLEQLAAFCEELPGPETVG